MKTAEWVTPKHPDKLCDQISDAILDAYLQKDPNSRVAVETMGGHGAVYITGEVTAKEHVNANVIRDIVERISGVKSVVINIVEQSPEIAQGVDTGGAGDQGIMVGYACDDNEEKIPQELYLARSLGKYLYSLFPYDGKTQVTIDKNYVVHTIVASFQNVKNNDLALQIDHWILEQGIDTPVQVFVNPAGEWNQGGFDADAGVTGRKLAVDNYGPQVPIGGGAFSGKDGSKVDRSGAYMARKIAVEQLHKHHAHEVIVKLAYSIGVKEPVMVTANIDGIDHDVTEDYNLGQEDIRYNLVLDNPQYERLARVGHFGTGNVWDHVA